MLEGIIVGVIIAVITILINAFVHRAGIETRNDRIEKKVDDIEDGQKVVFKSLLAILIAQRDGKTNGECEDALHDLNEYLIKK